MTKQVEGQTKIEVASAPNAVGRFEAKHEIEAYRDTMGDEATERQRELAVKARDCTCEAQAKADEAAKADGKKPRRLLGHQHRPGCNSYRKLSQSSPRISLDEQAKRFHANELEGALAKARKEGRL